jgi:XTP/dITP diphosphohydrolase
MRDPAAGVRTPSDPAVTMRCPPVIAIATRNPHKIDEIRAICADWPVRWVTDGAGWPQVDETGSTYLRNALLKAQAVAAATGLPALADDSGIEADAHGGAPGVRSARFAREGASDAQNLGLLIERLRTVDPPARTCRYRCVAVLAWPDGAEVHAEGVCEGVLIIEPRGSGGFGYDPAFVPTPAEMPDGHGRTMAELSAAEKNAISHRGRAFRALRSRLRAPEGP